MASTGSGALFGSFWANKKNRAIQVNKKNRAIQVSKKNRTIQENKVSQKRFQESKSQRKKGTPRYLKQTLFHRTTGQCVFFTIFLNDP